MASSKLTSLSTTTTVATTDLMYIVTDTGGTPTSEAIYIDDLQSALAIDGSQLSGLASISTTAGTIPTTNLPNVTEAKITLADVSTHNVSTTAHGFVPKADGVSTHFLNGAGTWAEASLYTVGTFDNTNLSSGILTVTHNKGLSAPYVADITIFDNSSQKIMPDNITGSVNTATVDLTSFGTISGTWGYGYI